MDRLEVYILRLGRALLYALIAFILIQWLPYPVVPGRWSFAFVVLILAMLTRTQVIAEIGLGVLLVIAPAISTDGQACYVLAFQAQMSVPHFATAMDETTVWPPQTSKCQKAGNLGG